jgi:hypothetical protein
VARAVSTQISQAIAVAALGVPAILFAHLLATDVVARPALVGSVVLAVLAVAAALPARGRAGLTLVTAATQVAGHTVLTLATAGGAAPSGCIPVVGRGARLGLQLALLQEDAACPAGSLAPGPTAVPAAATLTAVLATLAVLAGHAAAAVVTGRLLAAGARTADVVRAVRHFTTVLATLTACWRRRLTAFRILGEFTPRGGCQRPPTSLTTQPTPRYQWHPGVVPQRGPPPRTYRIGPRVGTRLSV